MNSSLRKALTNNFILNQKLHKDSGIWDIYYDLVKRSLFMKLQDPEKKQLEREIDSGNVDNFVKLCEEKLTEKDYDIINNYIHLKISKLFV